MVSGRNFLNPFGKSVNQASRMGRGASSHDLASRHPLPLFVGLFATTP